MHLKKAPARLNYPLTTHVGVVQFNVAVQAVLGVPLCHGVVDLVVQQQGCRIDQLAAAIPCASLQIGKFGRTGGKSFRVAVLFRLMRVRMKLDPFFLRMTPSRSSDSGKGVT